MYLLPGTVILIVVGSFLIGNGISICCRKEKIYFYPQDICRKIPGTEYFKDGMCVFKTCADLMDHNGEDFCSRGRCDSSGCNCDAECIQLDAWSKQKVSTFERRNKTVHLQDIF